MTKSSNTTPETTPETGSESKFAQQAPLAIVGVSALFPGSLDKTGFWSDILKGKDLVSDVPASHWLIEDYYDPDPTVPDKTYAKRGAFLDDVAFDPMGWGVPPSIVPATDTSQLLALMVAKQVLEDAGQGQFDHLDRERMSVILGVTSGQELMGSMASRLQWPVWVKALREHGLPESEVQAIKERMTSQYTDWGEANFPGLLGNVVAGRIANRLDLGGTNCVTDAACASAFSAMSMAANELWLGQSDVVICGGVDTMNDIFMYMCFSKTPALSATGDCRPFSDQADGTILGEGLSMVALRRLDDAVRDGDKIYAVVHGVGSSSDGRAKSVYAPLPAGQAKSLRRAYERAGYSPTTVELVEAHGTGTKAGDAAEFEGLRTVFTEADAETKGWCALGSVKSQIGHTKSCAGAAGLFKAVMALHHKVLPPTIKIDRPNPKMDIDTSPFYLSTELRPWVRGPDHPRRAGVSSFGFGGSNFHVAIEEYTGDQRADRVRTSPVELLAFSGADVAAIAAQLDEATSGLSAAGPHAPSWWRWLARDRALAFDATQPCRLTLVVESDEDLAKKVDEARKLLGEAAASTPSGIHWSGTATSGDTELGKVAFLFPGQGSQYVGMGKDVAMNHDAAIAAWDRAAGVAIDADVALHEVVFPRPVFSDEERAAQAERLTATEWAQPAIGVTSLSLLAVLEGLGLKPDCVGGHSFGEVTALHAAGVLSEEDAVKVARRRGELMAAAAEADGAMTAVSADIETVQTFLEETAVRVVVANHNSPKQVVLSGKTADVIDAEAKLKAAGLRFKRLNVATAFHSEVVSPATVPFSAFLEGLSLRSPKLPVYANSEAAPYPRKHASIRELLGNQIARPVRFVEQVEAMYADGVRTFVEVGPGHVLTGLTGRILKGKAHRAISTDRKGRDGQVQLTHALAQLAAAGASLQLGALWEGFRSEADPRTVKKPGFTLSINGANYGKPYPPPGGAADLPGPNPERPAEVAAPSRPTPAAEAKRSPVATPAAASIPPAPTSRSVTPVAQPVKPAPVAATAAPMAPTTRHITALTQSSPSSTKGAPAMSSDAQDAWLSAFQQTQALTAEAHASYQRAMADSHVAFLQSVETALQGLTAIATGQVLPTSARSVQTGTVVQARTAPSAAPLLSTPKPLPQVAAAPVAFSAPAPVTPAPIATAAPVAPAPAPVVRAPAPVAAPIASAPVAAAPLAAAAPAPGRDLEALMLDVVAESTGYPAEMLSMGMNLEADLGIDSIKRVEILSAVTEQAPELPEMDASAMGSLQTLGEIVEFMRAQLGGAPAAAAAAPAAAAPAAPAGGRDLEALMLDVVAESTGYPAEMLSMGMNLEADLGIDSIKRVEILSAVTEQAPELPEMDASAMGSLQTLGEIVEFMRAQLGGAPAAAAAAPAAAAPAAPAGGRDLEALMLDVVAESTGYPAEMLSMGMNLEADLGIDSIKRVEILSAVTEQAPELPEMDASAMGSLQTLGEIVEFMRAQLGGNAAAVPAAAAPAAAPAATAPAAPAGGRDLEALMLDVVAESTGYPAEMLSMSMNLEADLGIDSIKRVEILSAVTEQAPELPEMDASAMGSLQTLGEIVGFMREQLGAGAGNEEGSAGAGTVAPAVSPVVAGKQSTRGPIDPKLGRFHVTAVAAPPVGLSTSGLGLGKLAITDDGGGIAPALAERLNARGLQAEVVAEVPADATGVIFLGGLADMSGPDAGQVVLLDGFRAAKALGANLTEAPGIFVTVQDTGGDFGHSGAGERAWLAGLAGLAKTAAIEWPQAGIKAIDLQRGGLSPEALADRLVAELLFGGAEREVGLQADGLRLTLKAEKVSEPAGELCLDSDDVMVVSGGAKGVTAACVVELARQSKAKFLLLGRTRLTDEPAAAAGITAEPALKKALMLAWKAEGKAFTPKDLGKAVSQILAVREVKGTLAAVAAAGGEATYAAVDVTDAKGVKQAVAATRKQWGRISGFMHGAGVIADKLIVDKTEDQVEWVLGVKLAGLQALLAATAADELKAVVMFSSVAGRSGNKGQCDYAMANEVLNKVALDLAAHKEHCVVRSLGWGPWAGGMVTPQLKARFEAMGVALIGLDDGARMLVNSLRSGGDHTEVVLGGAPTEEALLPDADASAAPSATYEVWVDALSQPWLVDHTIADTTVVPVVLAMEWASRAGRAFKPDLRVKAIRDIKVLKGILLDGWGERGAGFKLKVKQLSNGTGAILFFELVGSSGRPHYTAKIELTALGAEAAQAARTPILDLSAWENRKVYGDVLFHGPEFQVIEEIDGIGEHGISGVLRGVRQAGWEGGWQTDPAALDGGLQLAVLWDREQLDGAFLPTGIKSAVTYTDGPAEGPFRCVVKGRTVGKDRSVTDILFTDSAGAPIYELLGVETHRRPSGA